MWKFTEEMKAPAKQSNVTFPQYFHPHLICISAPVNILIDIAVLSLSLHKVLSVFFDSFLVQSLSRACHPALGFAWHSMLLGVVFCYRCAGIAKRVRQSTLHNIRIFLGLCACLR